MRIVLSGLLALFMTLAGIASVAWSMPPQPDLLRRIRAGEISAPYALQHAAELRAAGVDAPGPVRTVEMLRRRALDENVNILAILVDFSDHTSRVQASFFDSLLYGDSVGTLRHFYEEVSYGNFTLMSVNACAALGWQRAPEDYAYYVADSNGFGNYPHNAQKLVEDVVEMVDPVVNFAQYDNDGDGNVDGLFVIHSGPGAEMTGNSNDIWSHAWVMSQNEVRDGVNVWRYSMEPEYWSHGGDMTCGVYCHEMGHAMFGFPDLYDYDYDSEGLGRFSLMAAGSWNGRSGLGGSPAHPDAFCTIQAGFITPTIVSTNLTNVSIPCTFLSPTIYRLWTNGTQGHEYFLVENREQLGSDAYLPGSGLLIYHVDDSQQGNDHQWYPGYTANGHYEVALEQADGRWDMERNENAGTAADIYPGTMDNRAFTNQSVPNSRDYNNAITMVSVRNVSDAADTMTADFAVATGPGNFVFLQMPDTIGASGDTVMMPVVVYDLTGQTITTFEFTVKWDSTVARLAEPFVSRVASLVPPSWTLSQMHSADSIEIIGSGSAPLAGQGPLLYLPLRIVATVPPDSASPVQFANLIFNQGNPPADLTNGSLTVVVPELAVQPDRVDFGPVTVGSRSTARSLICRNTGNANLILRSVTVPDGFISNFTNPITIPAGGWMPVRVTFAPDFARLYADTFRIYTNAANGETDIPLTGEGTALGGVADERTVTPTQLDLFPSYPNPFNPSTSVTFDVPHNAPLTITVYDVLGRQIDVPVSGTIQAGRHTFSWSCPSCASGVYLFVLSAEGKQITQKAMLMR